VRGADRIGAVWTGGRHEHLDLNRCGDAGNLLHKLGCKVAPTSGNVKDACQETRELIAGGDAEEADAVVLILLSKKDNGRNLVHPELLCIIRIDLQIANIQADLLGQFGKLGEYLLGGLTVLALKLLGKEQYLDRAFEFFIELFSDVFFVLILQHSHY